MIATARRSFAFWLFWAALCALLGLLVATGMALADWRALALAILVYLAGTLWRASREERLLREAFGPAYASYAARVPRLLPRFTRGAETR